MSLLTDRVTGFLVKADLRRPDSELRGVLSECNNDGMLVHACTLATSLTGRRINAAASRCLAGTFHLVVIVTFTDDADPRRVAVRLWRHPAWGTDHGMLVEAHVRPWLADAGVRAPAIIATDLTRQCIPTDAQLSSVVEGISLRELDQDDVVMHEFTPSVVAALSQLGKVQGSGSGPIALERSDCLSGVHRSLTDFLAAQLDRHVAICVREGCMTSGEVAIARWWFDALSSSIDSRPRSLLHGDPGNHNIFVRTDGPRLEVVLIDWEDACIGDPLLDLANWATFHPERRWRIFFESANEQGPYAQGSEERALFWLYYLRIALAKTVHRIRFGISDVPGRVPASSRIQRGLKGLLECGSLNRSTAGTKA